MTHRVTSQYLLEQNKELIRQSQLLREQAGQTIVEQRAALREEAKHALEYQQICFGLLLKMLKIQ